MKQYRITSAHFVTQGDAGEADAYIDPRELNELKRLAGMPIAEDSGGMSDNGAGPVGGNMDNVPQAQETGIKSPVGSTQRNVARERKQLEHEYAVQPGTDLWFIINFTQPRGHRDLKSYVEEYLKKNPEAKPKLPPGTSSDEAH
jgi:hypothetical protein